MKNQIEETKEEIKEDECKLCGMPADANILNREHEDKMDCILATLIYIHAGLLDLNEQMKSCCIGKCEHEPSA